MATTRKPEISIIVPFLNAAGTLPRCIKSIRQQTFGDFEFLLVDNGSDDDSLTIAGRAAELDERITLLRAEKKGVSAARNLGMKMALGRYITFVDADDLIRPVYLERLRAMLRESDADFAAVGFESFTDAEAFESAAIEVHPAKTNDSAGAVSVYSAETYITDRILYSDNHVWGKLYRKEFLDRVGASFEETLTIGEDMLFLLHITCMEMKAVCSEEKLYGYYVNPRGAIERPFTESYLDQVRCWEQAERWIKEHYPYLIARNGKAADSRENPGGSLDSKEKTPQTGTPADCSKTWARLSSIRVVAELLVASKMARLPAKERTAYYSDIQKMQLDVADAIRDPRVVSELPTGYGVKTKLFSHSPAAYFLLYGALKSHR